MQLSGVQLEGRGREGGRGELVGGLGAEAQAVAGQSGTEWHRVQVGAGGRSFCLLFGCTIIGCTINGQQRRQRREKRQKR